MLYGDDYFLTSIKLVLLFMTLFFKTIKAAPPAGRLSHCPLVFLPSPFSSPFARRDLWSLSDKYLNSSCASAPSSLQAFCMPLASHQWFYCADDGCFCWNLQILGDGEIFGQFLCVCGGNIPAIFAQLILQSSPCGMWMIFQ